MQLTDLPTPSLVLDLDRVERNCAAMLERARQHGVTLRPHLKTAKSADLARLASSGPTWPITVSTLTEVAYFAAHGFRDMTYAVGIAVHKLDTLAALHRKHGLVLRLLADQVATIDAVGRRAAELEARFELLIEIDCGGGRGGVTADGRELLELARAISAWPSLSLVGVLTHAGQSYATAGAGSIAAIAETERSSALRAATRLREAGFESPVVSIGSTPTVVWAATLAGVTEIRPGVYTLFDLDQVALGVCTVEDIAASVIATVIGHNPRSRRVLIDAGALALSKDQSANAFAEDLGYGLVATVDGARVMAGLRVAEVHQEHGLIAGPEPVDGAGTDDLFARLPIGARVRILPQHACMTTAPYGHYDLVRGESSEIIARWHKASGHTVTTSDWSPT
jgi:D-serine deaminase-like pyridoxal phosphate-dependent protein